MSYLFDMTSISNDTFRGKINGYRSVEFNCFFREVGQECANTYFSIYKWVYSGGNISDKIGLARNIITLFIKDCIFDINEEAISSIKSGYEIYLKEHIQRYIDIKNKISDNILDSSQRANSIIYDFTNSFKQNIFAFVAFYITVIVINSINSDSSGIIFTYDIAIISYGLIFISFLHSVLSVVELSSKIQRFKDSYKHLKDRYLDLIDKNDLEAILNKDSEHNGNIKFLTRQQTYYWYFWWIALAVFALITFTLS